MTEPETDGRYPEEQFAGDPVPDFWDADPTTPAEIEPPVEEEPSDA